MSTTNIHLKYKYRIFGSVVLYYDRRAVEIRNFPKIITYTIRFTSDTINGYHICITIYARLGINE